MGLKGRSSSKTKSSKRKRDKISSQKKSRRKESNKRIRVHDSDDESLSSEHYSSSTSKFDHRTRINRKKNLRRDYSLSSSSDDRSMSSSESDSSSSSHKRKKIKRSRVSLKTTKKKDRKRSSRPKDDGDVRKSKRSSRDRVVKLKSKLKKSSKKKYKKYSTSSSSYDSDTEDNTRRKRKIILDDKRERSRDRESDKSHKKRKIRSPSCSSFDRLSNHSVSVSHSDEALLPVNNNNNSRRLRSVITVADQRYDEEENIWEKDLYKEEIVYDQNEYPSPKSVDSNEGGNKMELENSKKIGIENFAGEEEILNPKSVIDEGDRDNAEKNSEKVEEIEDLEAILRRKALENLSKFKGRLQARPGSSTNLKMNNESDENKPSDRTVDNDVQNKSTDQVISNAREMNLSSGVSQKSDLSQLTEVKKLSDSEIVEKEPGLDTQADVGPPDASALLGCLKEGKDGSSNAISVEEDKDGSSNAISAIPVIDNDTSTPSSSVGPISGENSSERGNEEAKDGSQFQEKTMTVMRGGEMVQVSYKVYIPVRARAVARRQLRR